ncbi:transcription factor DIVARICATA-like [Typha latifolia]|uniref:transcription factor DIVARICATA-like n=1 Tax=Typha latifolia TaxID=4733 RepID=UPI003C309B1E
MMMEAWTEVLPPKSPCFSNSSWFLSQKRIADWTQEENKVFEDALARFDGDAPDKWEKVAALIPGKTVGDVITHYQDLENDINNIDAGFISYSQYENLDFTFDIQGSHSFEGLKQSSYCVYGKRSGGRASDQERKKGVPWSKEEHERFLLGLEKFGKGDWRNIARNFVKTRTPTQVASHAQKFFIRHNSGTNDKRRSSIHDITTVNLLDDGPPSPAARTMPSTSAAFPALSDQCPIRVDSNQLNEVATLFKPSENGNQLIQAPFGINPYGMMKFPMESSHSGPLCDSMSNATVNFVDRKRLEVLLLR